MGFPKKISQFPINPDLTGQDLLVTVNEFDVTSRINLQQLRDFVIDGNWWYSNRGSRINII